MAAALKSQFCIFFSILKRAVQIFVAQLQRCGLQVLCSGCFYSTTYYISCLLPIMLKISRIPTLSGKHQLYQSLFSWTLCVILVAFYHQQGLTVYADVYLSVILEIVTLQVIQAVLKLHVLTHIKTYLKIHILWLGAFILLIAKNGPAFIS